ncbi:MULTISPECIES: hypothetical protein [Sphingobium]|uniref:hypothetical protein n=1 Tax=Sphingobium TaxID=165695 RepID=UPI00076FE3BF|nr:MULTISPECIES: hypothetical protein [unclassified Sphingobium]AMK25790.1 hypothetical protein K426_24434 [Sphingobium sp. TKS]MEC6701404.1 hypothetical protein [Sphingobium sp. SJ10-10]NML87742.1 hypothetical protein [Sphingobium sp. TB-6]PNQ04348.1 hypothetical protein A8G00_01805 [Sphingobium sp. SA916]
MGASPQIQTFIVEVQFLSGDEQYGMELYTIDAPNWYRAEQHALERSGESVYDNALIPDLRRRAVARQV